MMDSINTKIIHSSLPVIGLILFCVLALSLGLRGLPGNPTAEELSSLQWTEDGPFELSPERGRFALTYSLAEDHSPQFSLPLARFVMPDLAINPEGKYVSLFAPAVSYLVSSGYMIGKYFNAAQVGTFAIVALFAIANILLIRAIAIRLGANRLAATAGALLFLFATPAFTYGVTLYQHHISVFIILLCVYLLIRWDSFWSLVAVWFLVAASVVVDNPNAFFMLPIALFALAKGFRMSAEPPRVTIAVRRKAILALVGILVPAALFLTYNQESHGNPFKLSGTLPNATVLTDEEGGASNTTADGGDAATALTDPNAQKTAVGFFKTRNLLNGFYVHLLSPDRGILYYAPLMLLGIIGLGFLLARHRAAGNLLIAIGSLVFVLYSLWGDPWGGWAFGSRYMIPLYAILAIGLGVLLTRWQKNYLVLVLFVTLTAYSVGVNTLGAVTSSRNPPQVEILALEQISGKEEKYTFERNAEYLDTDGSKSFVFQKYGKNYLTPWQYFWILTIFITTVITMMLCWHTISQRPRLR